jgi:hypothetical protein
VLGVGELRHWPPLDRPTPSCLFRALGGKLAHLKHQYRWREFHLERQRNLRRITSKWLGSTAFGLCFVRALSNNWMVVSRPA